MLNAERKEFCNAADAGMECNECKSSVFEDTRECHDKVIEVA